MSGWLEWQPKQEILTDSPEEQPAKPSEPGLAGFEGSPQGESSKLEDVLEGKAVELWSDAAGGRFWIVADEKDAATLMRLEGVGRGAIYTAPEMRLIIRMDDPNTVQMIHRWKLETHSVIRDVDSRA